MINVRRRRRQAKTQDQSSSKQINGRKSVGQLYGKHICRMLGFTALHASSGSTWRGVRVDMQCRPASAGSEARADHHIFLCRVTCSEAWLHASHCIMMSLGSGLGSVGVRVRVTCLQTAGPACRSRFAASPDRPCRAGRQPATSRPEWCSRQACARQVTMLHAQVVDVVRESGENHSML